MRYASRFHLLHTLFLILSAGVSDDRGCFLVLGFSSESPMISKIQKMDRPEPAEPRGSIYGGNNSTIPTATEAADRVGVKAPVEVSVETWKRAWQIHRTFMPILHAFDRLKPPDSSLSLMVLWWKALSANDKESPAYDNYLTYDLLPPVTRRLVSSRVRRFFPRLHHANVEIRTAFLDQSVAEIINQVRSVSPSRRIRLVSLGSGYDPRSIKFRERGLVDEAIELDLPEVVRAKQTIFSSNRFQRRRPLIAANNNTIIPEFYPVNLNELETVEAVLRDILLKKNKKNNNPKESSSSSWHTIFLFEAVMIYLDEGVPNELLCICSRVLNEQQQQQGSGCSSSGSLCFADRLERIPGGDIEIAEPVLAETGWRLLKWSPKPGLARHMGVAEPMLPQDDVTK